MSLNSILHTRQLQMLAMADAIDSESCSHPSSMAANDLEALIQMCLGFPADVLVLSETSPENIQSGLLAYIEGELRLIDASRNWAIKMEQSGYVIAGVSELDNATYTLRQLRDEIP